MTSMLGEEPTLWTRCPKCHAAVYLPKLTRTLSVCPECGGHGRISADERLRHLLDPGSFEPAADRVLAVDRLGFTDTMPYPRRLADARRRTGLDDAVCRGRGTIGGVAVVIAVMDFRFMGGSMGAAVGESVTRAAEEALASGDPLIVVTASGGARMQEGCLSLMQMAKTSQAFSRLRDAGVFSICVLTDPTFGGVTASFATLADVLVAERGSLIGFAGPRVIASATRTPLPEGFQTAEYLHEKGMLDRVESRDGLRPLLARLLALHRPGDVPAAPADVVRDPELLRGRRTPWETLRVARDITRPTTLDYLWLMCDDFVELHGDRCDGDDQAIVAGMASIRGVNVMAIGHQKGHDTPELLARNFGMPHPEGYRKALRLMRLAERLRLPVVTFVDTQGAAPGVGAEERGQAWAIAEAIAGMSDLTVPVVTTITGEGGSGGALAIAVANVVLALENACYSVISPESCSTILFGSPAHAEEMADRLHLTAPDLLRLGVVDGVVREPGGTTAELADALAGAVLDALAGLAHLGPEKLRAHRHERFRVLGEVADA